jgi:hypothetical protein
MLEAHDPGSLEGSPGSRVHAEEGVTSCLC